MKKTLIVCSIVLLVACSPRNSRQTVTPEQLLRFKKEYELLYRQREALQDSLRKMKSMREQKPRRSMPKMRVKKRIRPSA